MYEYNVYQLFTHVHGIFAHFPKILHKTTNTKGKILQSKLHSTDLSLSKMFKNNNYTVQTVYSIP